MTSPTRISTLEGVGALNDIKPQFLALFQQAFGRAYPLERWDHYYNDNPCGPALAVALWDGGSLAGFTALLRQEVVDRKSGALIPYGYNVTAMIAPEHRRGGLAYFQIMDHIKDLGKNAGLKFLLGFPNTMNFLTMTRFGGFRLMDTARFVRSQGGIGPYADFLANETRKSFFSDRLWKWRLVRFPYQISKGCITKIFNGEENIIDWLEINGNAEYPAMFPFWSSFGPRPDHFSLVDDNMIRFCCYPIDPQFDPQTLKKSILYSDTY